MKRFLLMIALVLWGSFLFAETAIQQDQNGGFMSLGTAKSFTIYPATFTDLLCAAPGNVASWTAANPTGQYVVIPERCKGFVLSVYGTDMVVGDPTDISTGTTPVGILVKDGGTFKWESKNPDQKVFRMRIYSNNTSGTVTVVGWGL